jgi:hypothetical protein
MNKTGDKDIIKSRFNSLMQNTKKVKNAQFS